MPESETGGSGGGRFLSGGARHQAGELWVSLFGRAGELWVSLFGRSLKRQELNCSAPNTRKLVRLEPMNAFPDEIGYASFG